VGTKPLVVVPFKIRKIIMEETDALKVAECFHFILCHFTRILGTKSKTYLGCTNFFLLSMQMNPNGKVQLVFVDIPRNLSIPLVSKNPNDIHAWNRKVDEYIVGLFDFAQMFLASNGVVFLFHPDGLRVLKEVKSYLESYGFQIWMKWVMVRSLPFMSSKDPSFKVPSQSTKLYLYFVPFQL
jgi:hypothetical protein